MHKDQNVIQDDIFNSRWQVLVAASGGFTIANPLIIALIIRLSLDVNCLEQQIFRNLSGWQSNRE